VGPLQGGGREEIRVKTGKTRVKSKETVKKSYKKNTPTGFTLFLEKTKAETKGHPVDRTQYNNKAASVRWVRRNSWDLTRHWRLSWEVVRGGNLSGQGMAPYTRRHKRASVTLKDPQG